MLSPKTQTVADARPGLGTFGGVFTPSILTILGVIMYLRFGWVVGNVGLSGTFLIVTLSTSITFLTALSISAISTAQRVGAGGAYYMISRSLGIEAGGAVGIPLYFAQALSVALYTIGFAESVVQAFPGLDVRFVGLVTTTFVGLLALKSADVAIKSQYFIMVAIGVSLVSFFAGGSIAPEVAASASATPIPKAGFWVVFAVFFPAVTGIMAGVNLSGDLKDPERSIPWGTLAAVGVGYVIYMTIPFFLSMWASERQLIEDPLVMRRIAVWGDAILIGVWGATLSSAVGSILGAPRVLQTLARDGVLPKSLEWLGQGSGPEDTPRLGTAVTFSIAVIAVLLGDLNVIAPILSMFFLTTYGVLNVTAALEQFLGNPSYRPRFRVQWFWSVLGAVGCIAVMFLINALATAAALVIVVVIYFWLERQELRGAWGDVRRSIWTSLARAGLMRMDTDVAAKNWRPHLLVLSGAPSHRWHLVELAQAITHNRSLLTVATVLPEASVDAQRRQRMETAMRTYLNRHGVQGLARVAHAPDPFVGARQLIEMYGLGSLSPNIVVLGDSEDASRRPAYCDLIRHTYHAQRNVLVVHHAPERGLGPQRRIDVWWGGLKKNGSLMMILAYLVRTSLAWRGATVRVKMVVPTEAARIPALQNLERILSSIRTGAEPEVLVAEGRSFDTILRTSSADSDLVFLGLAEPDSVPDYERYYQAMQQRLDGLPTTLLVLAAEDLAFGEVLLEENELRQFIREQAR